MKLTSPNSILTSDSFSIAHNYIEFSPFRSPSQPISPSRQNVFFFLLFLSFLLLSFFLLLLLLRQAHHCGDFIYTVCIRPKYIRSLIQPLCMALSPSHPPHPRVLDNDQCTWLLQNTNVLCIHIHMQVFFSPGKTALASHFRTY